MALNGTMVKIETVTVGSGGQASFDFQNIPQTYDDLFIVLSVRNANAGTSGGSATMRFNNDSASNYSFRWIRGDGANATSGNTSTTFIRVINNSPTAGNTADTFCNSQILIQNYKSSTAKSTSEDNVSENNTTTAYSFLVAGNWTGTPSTSAISRITITGEAGNFVQHSTATLYGISRTTSQIKATGGMVYDDADYVYHVFLASGTFTPSQSLSCDVLVVAGGGSGGGRRGGGGGAGGLKYQSSQSISTAQTITIGAGASAPTYNTQGNTGNNSSCGSITADGGGAGGNQSANGGNGGSGGGAGTSASAPAPTGGTATTGQGNNGGNGSTAGETYAGAGGGGAGAAGQTVTNSFVAGNGGNGSSTYSSWGVATLTGQDVSGTRWYAGGGGGGNGGTNSVSAGTGGSGGGGAGGLGAALGTNGTSNTGGGGGGGSLSSTGGAGGSGIVIIRYNK
jgi:hypothetical protein